MQGPFYAIEREVEPFMKSHPEFRFMVGKESLTRSSRTFYVCLSSASFVAHRDVGTWHEYVVPDRPVKLFLDVDDKKGRDGWDELLQETHRAVRDLIGRECDVRIWEAHTPEKKSAHVVFPYVWFENAASLYEFMQTLHVALRKDDRVDMQVYSRTAYKSLRVPYCSSVGKDNPLVPRGGPPEFDFSRFTESLITQGEVVNAMRIEASIPARVDFAELDEDPDKIAAMSRIAAWIQEFWSVQKLEVKHPLDRRTGRWVWHARPGIWCPIKRRRHARNNCMIRGTMVLFPYLVRMETYCLDADCRQWIENREVDWNAVAFAERSQHQNVG